VIPFFFFFVSKLPQTNVISKTVFNGPYTSAPGFSFYNPAQKNKILIRLIPSPNAVSADMVMRTYYKEYNLSLTDSSTQYVDFNVFQNAKVSNTFPNMVIYMFAKLGAKFVHIMMPKKC
jgi:hypothetical protein